MKKRACLKTPVTDDTTHLLNSKEDLDSTSEVTELDGKSKKPKKLKKKDAFSIKRHEHFLSKCNERALKLGKVAGKTLPGKTIPRPPTPPKPKETQDSVTQTGDSLQFTTDPLIRRFPKTHFKRGHLIGTKEEVWTGLRYKTSGGLHYEDLIKNKSGKIVSKLQSVRGATLGIKNLVPAQPKKSERDTTAE